MLNKEAWGVLEIQMIPKMFYANHLHTDFCACKHSHARTLSSSMKGDHTATVCKDNHVSPTLWGSHIGILARRLNTFDSIKCV